MKLDALEELYKARKPKGLANWKKLEDLASKLEGKQASHITFTTCYPGQEGSKKYLGSSTGNLHFLLGYCNPAFHVAPYHWKIVDPNLSDQEAKKKKHPSNPRYWTEAGLEMHDEGDLDEGKPHKFSESTRNSQARRSAKKVDAITVTSGYGRYVAVPSEGKVYSLTNGQVYDWSVVGESFFAATNPELRRAMDEAANIEDEDELAVEKSLLATLAQMVSPFDQDVYPLVKSIYPLPGSVVPVADNKYALVKSDCVELYDNKGTRVHFKVFDRVYDRVDICKGGDIHPSILLNFTTKYLNISRFDLQQFVHDDNDYLPQFAKGNPTVGFEDIHKSYDRHVIVDEDGSFRVIPVLEDSE